MDSAESYRRIKPEVTNDSAKTSGSRLLQRVDVQKRLIELNKDRLKRTKIDADTVLRELHKIATCDILEAYDDSGALKPLSKIPKEIRKAISSVKTREEFQYDNNEKVKVADIVEVKFWDKVKSLEHLGRHLKLFTDKVEIDDNSLARRLKEASERSKES
jgi:phage terminase small subunit